VSAFAHLLSPGRIGPLELRNRILMCPMGDSLADGDGSVSDAQVAYYEARARGGAALLLVGSVAVDHPDGAVEEHQTAASDDGQLPGLARLADAVHAHGARIAAQLVHNGAMALLAVAAGRPVLVPSAPKPLRPDRLSRMVTAEEAAAMAEPFTRPGARYEPRVVDERDLLRVVEAYAAAAERCARAGFDGIEVHAGHGYLIDAFLSPSTNRRTDGWGGTLAGRSRLLIEVLAAIRTRVGPDVAVWIRINAVEHHKADGEVFEEQLEVMRSAVAAGADAVHVSAYGDPDVATTPTDGYAPHTYERGRPGSLVEHARAVRAALDVPVVTMGRMEPADAEEALASGAADLVAMGRKLLADPDLPRKLAEGRDDEVRPCLYQYRCIGNIFVRRPLRCVANAATGREHEVGVGPAVAPRRVLVVGGGAAGLEAARVLAGTGHHVELWEAGTELGGTLLAAGGADEVVEQYRRWLVGEVERAGVVLRTGKATGPAGVAHTGADEVVVAAGATWDRPELDGSELLLTVPELSGWLRHGTSASSTVGDRVVVLGGGKPGLSIARACAERGRAVTLVEPSGVLGAELGLPGRWRLVADLEALGVETVTGVEPVGVTAEGLAVEHPDGRRVLTGDTFVSTFAGRPRHELADALVAAGLSVHRVGDCAGVRRIEGANLDALALARTLG